MHDLLETPVARNALDLTRNAQTAAQCEIMRRLRQSLRQYVERSGNLYYVGFVGHFSAGKSSTINSVLKSSMQRKTGLHPTDTTITLITQEKNSSSLLGVIREGHVTIRSQAVENPILEQVVLVDTPGTGDPKFIEEVARDFFPICDVILFLFSATSPLDKSDVPMLMELHKRLPFIPLYFVVTRADEFRINANKPLTAENLDQHKHDDFLAEVTARVNALLTPQVYFPKDFIVIDNKSSFNIDKLTAFLEAKGNSSSPQAHVAMHLNKVHFFHSNAKELREFFAAVLDRKLAELKKIVQAADRNIQKYQEIVQISNNNLTKAWADNVVAVNSARQSVYDRMKHITALPQSHTLFPRALKQHNDTAQELMREAKYYAVSLTEGLKTQVISALRDHFYTAEKAISETQIDHLTVSAHGIKGLQFIPSFTKLPFVTPTSLSRKSYDIQAAEAESLRDALADLRRFIRDLEESIQHRALLSNCEAVAEAAKSSLKDDLDKFFQNVELYRSGVFSLTTKESIATLGISRDLDELEAEFKEDDKTSHTSTAVNQLLPRVANLIADWQLQLSELMTRLQPLAEEIRRFRAEDPAEDFQAVNTELEATRAKLEEEVTEQVQSDLGRLCGNVGTEVARLLVKARAEFDSEITRIKNRRRKRYLLVGSAAAGFLFLAQFAYYHFKQPAPTTTFGSIVASVVGSLIIEAMVLFVTKMRAKVPEKVGQARERFQTELVDEIRKTTEDALRSYQFESFNEVNMTNRLARAYREILQSTSAPWQSAATELFSGVAGLHAKCVTLRASYFAWADELTKRFSSYFSDTKRNLEVLNTVAESIKKQAIEPSFELLEHTRMELDSVKQEIAAVQFD
jgi:predicted GTPase